MIAFIIWGLITLWSILGALYSEHFKVVYRFGLIPLVVFALFKTYWIAVIAWFIVILLKIVDIVIHKKLPPDFPKSLKDL